MFWILNISIMYYKIMSVLFKSESLIKIIIIIIIHFKTRANIQHWNNKKLRLDKLIKIFHTHLIIMIVNITQ